MNNINTDLYDKVVDRAAMIRLYELNAAGKVTAEIDGHTVRVADIIKTYKAKMSPEMRQALDVEMQKSLMQMHDVSSRSLRDLVTDQISHTFGLLDKHAGTIWSTKNPPRRVSEEIVLKNPLYKNTTLASGWAGVSLAEKKRIEQFIRKGVADGMSEADIADGIKKSSVFKITKQQAVGLTRTAITSVYSQADQQVYEANKGLLQGWQYVAVLDSRTTPLCAHRDGTIYPTSDTEHLPPAHWHCRSTTIPVVKSYETLATSEGIGQIRKRNLAGLSEEQKAYYDGQTPDKETYSDWLSRQPKEVQLRHLGDTAKVDLFTSGQLEVSKFQDNGRSLGIKELRAASAGYGADGDTIKFANAKLKLDTLKIGATSPDDLIGDVAMQNALREYYLLQTGDLNGTLSYTNYRGTLLHTKKAARARVLSTPPTEENLKFNAITGRYEDSRRYSPFPGVLSNNLKQVTESTVLKDADKQFINKFINSLADKMSVNERAAVTDNLRILFTRYRNKPEVWLNFKALSNSQMKFDVMNVSDFIETQLRKDANLLHKLKIDNYIDPVLGEVQLQELGDKLIDNIHARNKWDDQTAYLIARELRNVLDYKIPLKLRSRIDEGSMKGFYLKFARKLSLADSPDKDQFAVGLGRDLYNAANYRGSRREWFELGSKLLDDANSKGFYELETFGVQKRRMKSRNGNRYFGPYYDTFSTNLRIVDKRIQEYSRLNRKIDVGLRIGVTKPENKLYVREGYKTYFDAKNRDTRIPITSTSAFSDFPVDVVDKRMTKALNWASSSEYKIDPEYFDFIESLMNFTDDKGKSAVYESLNQYKHFMVERGDAYERIKAMKFMRDKDAAFSNHPFLDHRGRIYERGFIGPQSGEAYRPFLNTKNPSNFSIEEFYNFQDQIGSFLGGLSDKIEGNNNSLSILGRQRIAEEWRSELVTLGNAIRRRKPNDIRRVLDSKLMAQIDGEEHAKTMRFALELAKIDEYLGGNYTDSNLVRLKNYKIHVALEQDASSSGAQIIALTTKNRQLAQLSNVVPTTQKQRLYDEIAAATYHDPRFVELNKKLGLSEKDLRKASKAQNMVESCHV